MDNQKGFILTASWEDRDHRHLLKYYGVGENGPFEILINNFLPLFFVEKEAKFPEGMPKHKRSSLKLKNFGGQAVDGLYFNTQKDLYTAKDLLSRQESGLMKLMYVQPSVTSWRGLFTLK